MEKNIYIYIYKSIWYPHTNLILCGKKLFFFLLSRSNQTREKLKLILRNLFSRLYTTGFTFLLLNFDKSESDSWKIKINSQKFIFSYTTGFRHLDWLYTFLLLNFDKSESEKLKLILRNLFSHTQLDLGI